MQKLISLSLVFEEEEEFLGSTYLRLLLLGFQNHPSLRKFVLDAALNTSQMKIFVDFVNHSNIDEVDVGASCINMVSDLDDESVDIFQEEEEEEEDTDEISSVDTNGQPITWTPALLLARDLKRTCKRVTLRRGDVDVYFEFVTILLQRIPTLTSIRYVYHDDDVDWSNCPTAFKDAVKNHNCITELYTTNEGLLHDFEVLYPPLRSDILYYLLRNKNLSGISTQTTEQAKLSTIYHIIRQHLVDRLN